MERLSHRRSSIGLICAGFFWLWEIDWDDWMAG